MRVVLKLPLVVPFGAAVNMLTSRKFARSSSDDVIAISFFNLPAPAPVVPGVYFSL
jgi:hypothetical protein